MVFYMINIDELNNMSPIEAEYVYAYIYNVYKDKVNSETTNYENLVKTIERCPHCSSNHFIKYGFNKNRQKYKCKDCLKIFSPTTKTIFTYSNTNYDDWISFIACEINGLTLEQEVIAIGKSKTTCFNMRHKLYNAIRDIQEKKLSGTIELDPVYTKINLKGTKPHNMPRLSKKRGKHKTSTVFKHLSGISHHKVCIVSAIDSSDNILLKIAGLGSESEEKLDKYTKYFKKQSLVVCDFKTAIHTYCDNNGFIADIIPVIANKDTYKSPLGNSLANINQIHQEIKELIRRKHGISIRHLQSYLDWLVFLKKLKYKIEGKRRKIESYIKVMKEYINITNKDISKRPIPIDLYEAYGEYNYGIFHTEYYA